MFLAIQTREESMISVERSASTNNKVVEAEIHSTSSETSLVVALEDKDKEESRQDQA